MRKQYTKEFKQELVSLYESGISVKEICIKYDFLRSILYEWIYQYKKRIDNKGNSFTLYEFEKLQRELEQAQAKLNIIKKTNCLPSSPRKDKLEAIEKLFGQYPIKVMCRVLDIHHATFYNYHFRRVKVRQQEKIDDEHKIAIKRIFDESDQRFGVTKIFHKMKAEGFKISTEKISFLMKEMNLKSKQCKKKKVVVQPRTLHNYPKNKLNREFNQLEPNKFWVGDVTALRIEKSFFYLAVVMDLFSRKVVAYRLSSQNNNSLTINTFKDAYENRNRPTELSFHSDQGYNYVSYDYCQLLHSLKVNQSLSKRANPYDNAVIEAFFSNMKREEINSNNFEFFDELKECVDRYIKHYNEYRPHNSLKGKTPNQIEKEFFNRLSA